MRRADCQLLNISSRIVWAIFTLPFILVLLTQNTSANSYYYKKEANGVVYYTNVDPKSNAYKKIGSPWGTFRGTPRSQRGYLDKYKYSDKFDEHINNTARWYGVDPLLIKAMIKVESNFNPAAVSPQGAMGIMQLMPGTADRIGVTDPFDPVENIEGGVKYFNMLMGMFNNNITLAIAGYNAGENAVIKYGYKIPPYDETIEYVNRVYAHYDYLKKTPTERNIAPMIARESDRTDSSVKNKKSFIYVETLGGNAVGDGASAKGPSPKRPVLTVKTGKTEKKPDRPAASVDSDIAAGTVITSDKEGKYTVQLASFPDLGIAKEMEATLKSRTYPAYIEKVDLPGKGTWYRVKVGNFTTKDEAKKFGDDMISVEPDVKSILVTLN
jgi:cell division septation protein DedD